MDLLNFRPLKLDDIPRIRPYFQALGSGMCDYTVGGTVMWREYFNTRVAIQDDVLYFKVASPGTFCTYSVPVSGDPAARRAGYRALLENCRRTDGQALVVTKVPAGLLPELLLLFPEMTSSGDPDWYDYIYDSAEFSALKGKKYSGQRNHINRFLRDWPDWRAEPVGPENLLAVSEFFDRYVASRDKIYDSFYEEEAKVREVLDNYDTYGFLGTALWAGGRVVAFSMGEIQGDTLFVHIEKADRRCTGAYQMISHQFAKAWGGGVSFLNREEDMGDEGLRISKRSYHPVKLLEKFTVRIEP